MGIAMHSPEEGIGPLAQSQAVQQPQIALGPHRPFPVHPSLEVALVGGEFFFAKLVQLEPFAAEGVGAPAQAEIGDEGLVGVGEGGDASPGVAVAESKALVCAGS
jgi:hypothetical protein